MEPLGLDLGLMVLQKQPDSFATLCLRSVRDGEDGSQLETAPNLSHPWAETLVLELEIGDAVRPIFQLGRAVCVGSEGRGWISRVLMHAGERRANIQRASSPSKKNVDGGNGNQTIPLSRLKIPKRVVRHGMQIGKRANDRSDR